MKQVIVSRKFFEALYNKIHLLSIVNGKAADLITYRNKKYILTGAFGTGTGIGWQAIYAQQVLPIESYTGELKPLRYNEHFREVGKGNRKRSYEGLLLKFKETEIVVIDKEFEFIPPT